MTESTSRPGGLFEPVPTHRPRSDLAGAAAYAIIVPFLAVVICAFSLIAGVRGRELTMVAIATLTLVVAFIPIGSQRLLHPDRRHIFISFICLAFPVYFVLPVFTQYFWGGDDTGSVASLLSLDLSDIIQAQLAALVSLVCLIIGFASPLGILVTAIFPRPRHEWGHQNALMVGVGMVVVGWLTFALGQLGLLPRQLGSGALGAIISSYYFGLALLTIVYLKFQSRQALVVLLALLPLAMLVGFLTGSKRLFLAPAALIALAHMVTIRRARAFWFVGGLTGVVLIYPIASFYREVVQAGNVLSLAEVLRNPGRMLLLVSSFVSQVEPLEYFRAGLEATTNRLNYLGILTLIVRDAGERVPFQGGWTIGLAFISFIPRIFWPGKPATSIGQWVTDNFGSGPNIESSTGPSQIGELFFNFGWPGIVIGWILLGIYFRTISEMFFRKDAPTVALMIAVIALWTTLPALGGTFTNFISGFLFNAGYIGVLHMGVRVFLGTSIPRPNSQPTTSLPFR